MISLLRQKVDKEMTRRQLLYESLSQLESQKITVENRHLAALKAREFFHLLAQETQSNIEESISSIVSLALNAVFDDPYTFRIEFIKRRNKMECDLFLENNNERIKPIDSVGGGVLDIIGFALRVPMILIGGYRKILILDEPMRFLSRNYQSKAAAMFSMISKKVGIQIIMATHIQELIDIADCNFPINELNK